MTHALLARPPFRTLLGCGSSFVALIGLSLALASPAMAQVRGQTAPGEDQRRVGSGARITSDTNPEEKGGKADDERLHDAYQPKGVDLGLFLLLPKLELDEAYNTNLYAAQTDRKGEFVTVVRPELKLRSRFKEHALNIAVLAEQYLHRQYTDDNRLDAEVSVDGRYDFSSETQANVFQQFYARHEERGSPDDARGVKPTPTQGLVNRTSAKHQAGRYTFVGEVGVDRRAFEDVTGSTGTLIPNQDRDRWEFTTRGRAAYELFPGYAAVSELSVNTRRYDQAFDRNGYQRDSHGYRAEAGIGLDISQLIRGDFLVGYFSQDYKDPRFQDPKGVSVRATFNWTPTKLTIIVPTLERTVAETTTLGASSIVRSSASVTLRHELERNILLSGFAGVTYDNVRGVSNNNAWTYEARARATYAFSPELFAGGEVVEKIKKSEAAGGSFNQTVLMLRLGLQL
jgi:hypothetical protein